MACCWAVYDRCLPIRLCSIVGRHLHSPALHKAPMLQLPMSLAGAVRSMRERDGQTGSAMDRQGAHVCAWLQGEPRGLRDYLGGDVALSVLAAVNFPSPLPAMRAAGMHGHVFLNGGNVMLLGGSGRSLRDCWQDFTASFRWSVVSVPGSSLLHFRWRGWMLS
jgi:hypothetical protein